MDTHEILKKGTFDLVIAYDKYHEMTIKDRYLVFNLVFEYDFEIIRPEEIKTEIPSEKYSFFYINFLDYGKFLQFKEILAFFQKRKNENLNSFGTAFTPDEIIELESDGELHWLVNEYYAQVI